MATIMPSQIALMIERLFPHVTNPIPQSGYVQSNHISQLTGIAGLTKSIPPQLIVDAYLHSLFVRAAAIIDISRDVIISRGYSFAVEHVEGVDVATTIYRFLKSCPDEFPSENAAGLDFISDEDVRHAIRADIAATGRALENAEWKAGTILAGAAIEALLYWAIERAEESARAQARERAKQSGALDPTRTPSDWTKWTLPQLIEVGAELNIIEDDTLKAARQAKDYRNLIHPSVGARKNLTPDRGTALLSIGALEHVVRDLSRTTV